MISEFQHYSIMVLDVVGFGGRDDRFQQWIRRDLDELVSDAFKVSGLVLSDMVLEDRGDGMVILIPATVSKMRLLDPLVDRIEVLLRQHNDAVSDQRRIRLRLALHAGEIAGDGRGWVGTELNTAFRLVDSEPIRAALEEHPEAQLAVIVSDLIHQLVIRHGHGAVRPSDYVRVSVKAKELVMDAWIRVTGRHVTPSAPVEPRTERRSATDGGGTTFNGPITVGGDFVGGSKIVGRS